MKILESDSVDSSVCRKHEYLFYCGNQSQVTGHRSSQDIQGPGTGRPGVDGRVDVRAHCLEDAIIKICDKSE
jgi:hypothetical protein